MMRVVCAWCGEDKGEKPGPDGKVTHTICKPCMEVALERDGIKREVVNA